jgi:hypothetical protein
MLSGLDETCAVKKKEWDEYKEIMSAELVAPPLLS